VGNEVAVIGVVHRGRPIRYILKPYISVTNKFTASLTEHTHTHMPSYSFLTWQLLLPGEFWVMY